MLEGFTPFGEDHPLDLPVATMAARVRDKDDALTAVELVKTALLRIEGTDDEWSAQVPSDPQFLDCAYNFEYYLLFIAEDEEGVTHAAIYLVWDHHSTSAN